MKIRQTSPKQQTVPLSPWRAKIHEIIFEAETPAGKLFDVLLLIAILLSTLAVMLESVREVRVEFREVLTVVDWAFTVIFTFEYIARILSVGKPFKYIFSFYGMIDLLSILPTYLGLFFTNASTLSVIRAIRVLRVFRVFKLGRYVQEGDALMYALKASRWRITVFFGAVLMICVVVGAVMYVIEGGVPRAPGEGFTSIPRSIYWAIVTLTTVGYGDISPSTALGQFIAAFVMILGYAIIAVPTGIVTAELAKNVGGNKDEDVITTNACVNCAKQGHAPDASYCSRCGTHL